MLDIKSNHKEETEDLDMLTALATELHSLTLASNAAQTQLPSSKTPQSSSLNIANAAITVPLFLMQTTSALNAGWPAGTVLTLSPRAGSHSLTVSLCLLAAQEAFQTGQGLLCNQSWPLRS